MDRISLHQFEDGPVLAPDHLFLPGETIFFSCRLTGYQMVTGKDEQRSVKLSWQIHVSDPNGVPLVRDVAGRIDEPVFPQDKNWFPKFLHSFVVPAFAPGGTYHISAKAKDEVSGSELTSELTFQVRGTQVDPSPTLAARNLRFLRTEEDGAPLNPALYHPGETMWARFEITGYRYQEQNRYAVEYGLAILKEGGEQVFAEPGPSDTNQSFYPQRYVPGQLSLHLDPAVPAGNYTLLVTVKDSLGMQTAEARGTFSIER